MTILEMDINKYRHNLSDCHFLFSQTLQNNSPDVLGSTAIFEEKRPCYMACESQITCLLPACEKLSFNMKKA